MKKRKFLATLAMSIATFSTSSLVAFASPLYYPEEVDANNRGNSYDWGRHAIHWAYADGVTVGNEKGEFTPEKSITRAEAVTMLTKFKNIDANKYSGDSKVFKDVNGKWYTSFVNAAYENGIVAGKGDGIFAPNDTLTRAEAVTMLVKAMGYEQSKDNKTAFTDISDGWYTDYIKTGYDNKIVSGKSEKVFDPNGNVTRAEYAMMLYNSSMGAYEKGTYCAVMIDRSSDSFKIVDNEETLLSYDAKTGKVVGATKVSGGDDWAMVYFKPSKSFEVEFEEVDDNSLLRFFANGHEDTISTFYTKKIVFAEDGSVTCYRDNKAALYPLMNIYSSNNMKLEVANGESATIDQKFENGFKMSGKYEETDAYSVDHSNSEYIKFTPVKDNLSVEMGVDFAVGGDTIAQTPDGNAYLFVCEEGKKLVVDDKVYAIDPGADLRNINYTMGSLDYDQDGQTEYLIELFGDENNGLYAIKLKEDQSTEMSRIDVSMWEAREHYDSSIRLYGLKGKEDEAVWSNGNMLQPISLNGTDIMEENPNAEELRKMDCGDYYFYNAYDYDSDGDAEYAIIKQQYYFMDSDKKDTAFKESLYVIDKIDGAYKVVQCPEVTIDELPKAKAAIEGHVGFSKFLDNSGIVYVAYDDVLEWCIDFWVDYGTGEEEPWGCGTVHYELPIKYHADGTFSIEDTADGTFSLG